MSKPKQPGKTVNSAGIPGARALIENAAFAGFMLAVFWLFTTQLQSHFTLPKLTATVLFVGVFLLSSLHRSWHGPVNDLPRVLWFALSALVIWWLLGTSQSIHLQTALEGQYGRYNGLYTNILWLILFVAVARTPINEHRIENILHFIYLVSVPVCLYAFVQKFGFDPLKPTPHSRPYSSIGNAVSLGAIIMMVIPFALNDFIQARGLNRRLLLLTLLVLLLLTEMITGSRGTWIGSVFAIGIVLFGYRSRLGNTRHWLNRHTLVALAFIVTVPIISIDWSPLLQRFSESAGINVRLMYFTAAIEIIRDYPVFGNGFESFRLVYPGYRPVEDAIYYKDVIPTMVHNDYLQLAVDNGLPALFFYLSFLFVALRILYRASKSNGEVGGFLLACIASVTGFLLQALSGWNEVSSSAFFWFLLGLGISAALSQRPTRSTQTVHKANSIIAGASLVLTVFFAHVMIEFVKADYAYRQMLIYKNTPTDKWINMLDGLGANDAHYQDKVGRLYLKRLNRNQGGRRNYLDYRKAVQHLRKAIELNRFNPYSRIHLMQADTIALRRGYIIEPTGQTRLNITELEKMDPNNPTVYKTRARLYAAMGRQKEASNDLDRVSTFPKLKGL